MRPLDSRVVVSRVRSDEGPRTRDLRLQALVDPAAPIAFLETREQALARPDSEWRERAELGATATDQASFVAEVSDGFGFSELVGTVTVIPRRAGESDYFGRTPTVDTATLVGVYVLSAARGLGVIDALIEAAVEWARGAGYPELTLDVHERNAAAIASYRRAGFELVGEFEGEDGRELAMSRPL